MGLKLLLMVMSWSVLHPIHVSITDLALDKDRKALEFTTKVFIDDVEQHFRIERQEPFLDITNLPDSLSMNSLMQSYLLQRIKISINSKAQELVYVGSEMEDDVIYLYYQVINVKKLNRLTIENRVLTDLFDDQVNMIHYKTAVGDIKSIRTTREEPEGELILMER